MKQTPNEAMKQTRNKADLQQSKPPAKHTPNEVNIQEDLGSQIKQTSQDADPKGLDS